VRHLTQIRYWAGHTLKKSLPFGEKGESYESSIYGWREIFGTDMATNARIRNNGRNEGRLEGTTRRFRSPLSRSNGSSFATFQAEEIYFRYGGGIVHANEGREIDSDAIRRMLPMVERFDGQGNQEFDTVGDGRDKMETVPQDRNMRFGTTATDRGDESSRGFRRNYSMFERGGERLIRGEGYGKFEEKTIQKDRSGLGQYNSSDRINRRGNRGNGQGLGKRREIRLELDVSYRNTRNNGNAFGYYKGGMTDGRGSNLGGNRNNSRWGVMETRTQRYQQGGRASTETGRTQQAGDEEDTKIYMGSRLGRHNDPTNC